MNFTNTAVRRQDRLLNEEASLMLLSNGDYGILSMQAEEGGAYGIPISYVWDRQHSVYVHCAPTGRKLICLNACNRVSFCIVGKTRVISEKFTTAYESIILVGIAQTQLSPPERMKALLLLLDKYSPEDTARGARYAQQSFDRTEIIRLDIKEWSGKSKRAP